MDSPRAAEPRCSLCGRPLTDAAADTADGSDVDYCSSGCREIDATLDGETGGYEDVDDARDAEMETDTDADAVDTDAESSDATLAVTFFRVDGMHSAMCEAFIESIAEAHNGVSGVAASYVTESVRVEYDPDAITKPELQDALSTVGYTAYLREDATGGTDDADADGSRANATGSTRRSREMTGIRKRRSEDALELQYVAGIVFGTFLLVPYVAVFYPIHLSAYSDWGMLALYGEAFATFDGVLMLPMFLVLTGIVLYLTGLPLLRGAYISLKLRRPNTQLLAALTIVAAYIYGTIAFLQGRPDIYYDLTIVVAAVVMGAIFAEATVKRRATARLTELTISQVDSARLLPTGDRTAETDLESIPVAALESGDRVLVREGERIPVDGVLESACTVDEAVVTGESLPISKTPGDDVIGGSVVTGGAAVVAVGDETTSSIDRLTDAVWNLQSADHGEQRRADVLAARCAPLVLGAAIAVGIGRYVLGGDATSVTTAVLLTVVVASPWALGLATPATVAASLQRALDRGIVVFDETVFERLREVDVVVFDKTGTLTTGEMSVLDADAPDDLLQASGVLEARASHPAASAIAAAFGEQSAAEDANHSPESKTDPFSTDGGSSVDDRAGSQTGQQAVSEFDSHGTGVSGVVDGDRICIGHPDLVRARGCDVSREIADRAEHARSVGRLPVVLGRNGRAEGLVVVGDEPRPNWESTLEGLHDRGIDVVVVTGDEAAATAFFADHPCIEHVFAGVPPEGKAAAIRRLGEDAQVAMVGDGTNDATALAEADLGISLGSGTALASDAADLAIVEDDLGVVERSFRLAAAAYRRIEQNLRLALVYNAIVIPIGVLGALNPLFATGAVAVTAALVGMNAWRPLLDE